MYEITKCCCKVVCEWERLAGSLVSRSSLCLTLFLLAAGLVGRLISEENVFPGVLAAFSCGSPSLGRFRSASTLASKRMTAKAQSISKW